MHGLPREQQLHPHEHDVLLVPHEGLHQCFDPRRARRSRVPDLLRDLPRHGAMDQRKVRSQHHRFFADGLSHRASAAVCGLPHQQQLHPEHHGLRLMPSEQFQQHHESKSPNFRIPAAMRSLPRHRRVDEFDVQSQQHDFSVDGLAYCSTAPVRGLPCE